MSYILQGKISCQIKWNSISNSWCQDSGGLLDTAIHQSAIQRRVDNNQKLHFAATWSSDVNCTDKRLAWILKTWAITKYNKCKKRCINKKVVTKWTLQEYFSGFPPKIKNGKVIFYWKIMHCLLTQQNYGYYIRFNSLKAVKHPI